MNKNDCMIVVDSYCTKSRRPVVVETFG